MGSYRTTGESIRIARAMRWMRVAPLVLAGIALSRPAGLQAQDDSTAARIERLEQQLLIHARLDELWRDSLASVLRAQPVVSAGRDGFSLRSADGAFALRFRGYLHSDGRFFLDDSLKPGTSQFLLRRVRPIMELTVFRIFDARIMPDYGAGNTVLQDAYVEARLAPGLRIRAGKYKPPVGLERLLSATELPFVERGLPTNLVPNRDVGVQLSGDLFRGRVSYAVSLSNGVPDGGIADGDQGDDKELAGRVFLTPFRNRGNRSLPDLGFGVAGSYGNHAGTPSTAGSGLAGYRSAGQQTVFAFRSDNTPAGTVVADGRRTRLSPQGYLYAGPLGLLAEYVRVRHRVSLNGAIETIPVQSWQVAGTFGLFGGRPTLRGINPRKPFDPGRGSWGALELAARYGELTVDEEAFPVYADPAAQVRQARGLGLGVNWYLNRNLKLATSYERTTFRGGAAVGDRETENVVFTRAQVGF